MNRSRSWRPLAAGLAIALVVAVVPLGWRVALHLWSPGAAGTVPSYLPSLERERPRGPFIARHAGELRETQPGFVIIGDSMAGRIDPDVLGAIAGGPVAPILQNATGSAYWYLVFKNYVLASGIRPRWVIVFFRDTNMTDVTFRLDGPYRATLDEVAHDAEPELDAIVAARIGGGWSPVHRAFDAIYRAERAREWAEPALNAWPARVVAGERQDRLLQRLNTAFDLEHLRPMAQADLAATDEASMHFARDVDRSVLPAFFDGARPAGLRLCFVRVLRRPVDGAAPPEPPAMQQYSNDMRAWIEARGGVYIDDRDDPELARLPYADGDHVSRDARDPYTRRFWEKLRTFE